MFNLIQNAGSNVSMFVRQKRSIFSTIKVLIFMACASSSVFSPATQAADPILIHSLANLSLADGETQAIVPYSIFSNAMYTSNLNTFYLSNYKLKIQSPAKSKNFLTKISKISRDELCSEDENEINETNIIDQLPWWSKSAPQELTKIDFSKIDGKLKIYNLDNGYRLSLLAKQGNWGKVYLLEHVSSHSEVKKICAVKLILTRSDRSLEVKEFHKRHLIEIVNNLKISNLDIAVKPYGIVKNDDDHYLLFMEHGEPAHNKFKKMHDDEKVDQIYSFFEKVNQMHAAGFAHGDLKLDNMLVVGNKFKLCDWFSLNEYHKTIVGEYRYIGDNLPPEAIRANYFKDDKALRYSVVGSKGGEKTYLLHPIAADRFCLAVSLLEILEPDLYKKISYIPKDFNPWAPKTLDFYPQYVNLIKETQSILLERANKIGHVRTSNLYRQLSQFIDLDPLARTMNDIDIKK